MKAAYKKIVESLLRSRSGELSTWDLVNVLHEKEWRRGNQDEKLAQLRLLFHDLRRSLIKGPASNRISRWEKEQIIGHCVMAVVDAHHRNKPELISDRYLVSSLLDAGYRRLSQQSFNATYKPAVRKALKQRWNIDL